MAATYTRRLPPEGHLLALNVFVQRQIELQDVHTRLPEETERASISMLRNQALHLLD
jgi:hypothetical protein